MAHPPNEQQLAAITEFGTDLLVSAGAGTGKTTVLAGKFLQLLEERRADIGSIVAITFTKKAAIEMRDRIRRGIQECLAAAADKADRDFWQAQLQQVDSARISTFHSLCLGLIQEHPLEAGLPPVSGVLGDGEERIYLTQAVTTTLTGRLGPENADRRELLGLILDFGWEPLLTGLLGLYQAIRESGRSFAEVLADSRARLTRDRPGGAAGLMELTNEIDDLLSFSAGQKLTENAQNIIAQFREDWPELRAALASGVSTERIAALNAIAKGLPKNLPAVIKERVVAIRDLAEAVKEALADEEALARLPLIGNLLVGIDRQYTALKMEAGVLDFTDQQLLARELLRNHPEIAADLVAGINYLLVDEFQDTNSLQLELIQCLRGDDHRQGRLMVVGDVKQSIYRFRGAEAGLMIAHSETVARQQGRIVALTKNYRSEPAIIGFVNAISQALFSGEPFAYEALEAGTAETGSGVELICCGETADPLMQARMVARRIACLVANGEAGTAPVRYGDIVILFRAGTAMPLYQQALKEAGIPHYTAGGGDLYQRQEIADQLNLLRLVQQSNDAVALLGLLLSPYVGLSETGLLELARAGDLTAAFYGETGPGGRLPEPEADRLARFRELIVFFQQRRELLSIPEILRTAIERLDYRAVMLTADDAAQRLANLDKLIVKAEEFTAKGYHDLQRFLSYIRELEGMEVGEGEAQTEAEGGNVVRLMTIHRSKGLEFPVVILPDLDRQFRFSSGEKFVFHRELGIGFKIPLGEGETEATSIYNLIKERERREEIAELKRVLYVALTRAKQRLILSGSGRSRSRGNTLETASNWMKWLELLLEFEAEPTTLDFHGVPVQIIRELPENGPPVRPGTWLEQIASDLERRPATRTSSEVAVAVENGGGARPVTLKVSGIVAYKDCPRRYYWRYWQRLEGGPAAEPLPLVAEEAAGDGLGVVIGNFIHQAVRRNEPSWPELLWERVAETLPLSSRDRVEADLRIIWSHLTQSPYWCQNGSHWDELPFTLKLDPLVRVEGRFDRLLQNERGELVLVDFKTHRIGAGRVGEAAKDYFWQLRLYALAVEGLWGRLPDRVVLFFPFSGREVAVPLVRDALDETVAEVRDMARFIAGHDRPEDYPASGACRGCSFGRLCRG